MPRPRIFPLTKTESEKMILRDVSFKNDFRETSLKFDLDVFAVKIVSGKTAAENRLRRNSGEVWQDRK